MTTRSRINLAPLTPADAESLRRFAVAVERPDSRRRWFGTFASGLVAQAARDAADRLDAGDIHGLS